MESFLQQATIYLAAAVIAVPLSARLGAGSVLGYLAAGVVIGPVLGLVGHEAHGLRHVAEFGVVMMLFLIGLELDPRALWAMRDRILGMGVLQIVATTLALMGVGMLAGLPWNTALAVGMTLALSSTAIVLQTLTEKGLIQTKGGRGVFSVLLTQDVAVIPFLAVMPLFVISAVAPGDAEGAKDPDGYAEFGAAWTEFLPNWGVALAIFAAIAFIFLAGIFLVRPVFRYIQAASVREMHTALALVIVVGISFIMTQVGLTPALGAFLAGVVLANTEFRHELESDLTPFKGLLLGLFFISVGTEVDFHAFAREPGTQIGLALLVTLVKGLILFAIAWSFGLRRRDKWLFTLGLAQAGEFGFVLLTFAAQLHVIPVGLSDRLLMVITISMLITPLLFMLLDYISRRLGEDESPLVADDPIDHEAPIIIAGIGRFGQTVNRLVRGSGFETIVLDHSMTAIQAMRHFGIKGFLGDPTRPDLLKAAGIDKAHVLVAALDAPDQNTKLVTLARKLRPDLHIVARARDRIHAFGLYAAGANDIVRETFDASLRAGRYVLERSGMSEFEAARSEAEFYDHDRYAVRELAQVWDPDLPPTENPAYVKRSRELETELEQALLATLERAKQAQEDGEAVSGPDGYAIPRRTSRDFMRHRPDGLTVTGAATEGNADS